MTSSNGNIFRVAGHLCWEFTDPRWIPAQRPVTRSFDVFYDLHPNKRLSKQWWGWWFETPSCPLWRHRNGPGTKLAIFSYSVISISLVTGVLHAVISNCLMERQKRINSLIIDIHYSIVDINNAIMDIYNSIWRSITALWISIIALCTFTVCIMGKYGWGLCVLYWTVLEWNPVV